MTDRLDLDAVDRLARYVGSSRHDFMETCWAEGASMVDGYIGSYAQRVPAAVRERAILEVGAELFHRRQAPGGITQFAAEGGAPVRMARDPMLGAYPLLNRFLPGGFA